MNVGPVFLGLVIVFGMGACTGNNMAPETKVETKTEYKVKIIRVPEVITHVDTVTKNVYKPLPVACRDAVAELEKIQPLDDAVSRESSKTKLLLDGMIQDSAMADFKALNETVPLAKDARNKLGTALSDKLQAERVINSYIEQCDKEMEKE